MKSVILFENEDIMGVMPYKNYNCSIIKLNKEETSNITNKIYIEDSILIIFFVASPGKRYGTMSWVGVLSYENLIKLLNDKYDNDNLWFIKPHLLQNDKGPKCADLRIFKMISDISIIGYSRVAPFSNIKGIPDYYVRTSLLCTKINNDLYKKTNKLFSFPEIDGGCFPYKIGNNYDKFKIGNDICRVNNIEFWIENNKFAKLVVPHKSKNKLMPNKIELNGIEVSFSKFSSNENLESHISTKNIIPLQHINYLDKIGCFVDFSPPDFSNPNISIQDMITKKVYYNNKLIIDSNFKCKNFRGSTPIIEIDNDLWITLVHRREKSNKNRYLINYEYLLVIFNSRKVILNSNEVTLPYKCIKEIQINTNFFKNEFIYITGLVIIDKVFNEAKLKEIELLLSYGISDIKSGISILKIKDIN